MPENVHEGPWPGSSAEPEPDFSLETYHYFASFKQVLENAVSTIPEDIMQQLSDYNFDELEEELNAVENMSNKDIFAIMKGPDLSSDWGKYPAIMYFALKEARKRLEAASIVRQEHLIN